MEALKAGNKPSRTGRLRQCMAQTAEVDIAYLSKMGVKLGELNIIVNP